MTLWVTRWLQAGSWATLQFPAVAARRIEPSVPLWAAHGAQPLEVCLWPWLCSKISSTWYVGLSKSIPMPNQNQHGYGLLPERADTPPGDKAAHRHRCPIPPAIKSWGRSCISSMTWMKKVAVVVVLLYGYMSLLIQNANWFTWHLHNGLCWHWQRLGTRILRGRGCSHLSQGEKSLGLAWPRWEMLPSSRVAQALWAAAHIAAYITE